MKKKIVSTALIAALLSTVLVVPTSAEELEMASEQSVDEITQIVEPKEEVLADELLQEEALPAAEVMPEKLTVQATTGTEYVSIPATIDYNVQNIWKAQSTALGYGSDTTDGGAYGAGSGGAFFAKEFKEGNYVTWKKKWSDVTGGINGFTSNGVDFNIKVVDVGSEPQNSAFINADGKGTAAEPAEAVLWKTIDLEDLKYESVDLLMAFALNSANPWANQELRLNYTDGTHEYFEFKDVKKPNQTDPQAIAAVPVPARLQGVNRVGDNPARIFHYTIPANKGKAIDSISVMSYNYDFAAGFVQGQTTTPAIKCNNSKGNVVKAVNIYAVTGVTTKEIYLESIVETVEKKIDDIIKADSYDEDAIAALQDEIATAVTNGIDIADISNYNAFLTYITDSQPVSCPATIDYNIPFIYAELDETGNAPGLGNAGGNGAKGEFYYYNDFINSKTVGWKEGTTWVDNDENVLTHAGVDFKLKVVNDKTTPVAFANKDGKGTATTPDEAILWKDIDLVDMKYSSVDLLMAFALASTGKWDFQEIRLNYKNGDKAYVHYQVRKANQSTPADAVGSVETHAYIQNIVSTTGRMHHYSIITDPTKVLDSISVMSYNYSFDTGFVQGQTTTPVIKCHSSKSDVTKAVNIYAVTGITTVGQYKEWADEQAKVLDTQLATELTQEGGELKAITKEGVEYYKQIRDMIEKGNLDEADYLNYGKVQTAMPKLKSGSYIAKDGIITVTLTFSRNMADLAGKINVTFNGETAEDVAITQEGATATVKLIDRYDDSKDYVITVAADAYTELGSAFNLGKNAVYSFSTSGNMAVIAPEFTAPVAGKVSFKATLTNTGNAPKPYYLLVCAYNDKGNLVGMNFITDTLGITAADDTAIIDLPVTATGAESYKAIFMSDIASMKTIYTTVSK